MPRAAHAAELEPSDVRSIRTRLQLTQQEFATLLGLSTVSVARWEAGQRFTDSSRTLLGLLDRALTHTSPARVVMRLREVMAEDDVDRVVALVHLGDD